MCVLARESKADTVIASAGTIPLDMVNNQIPSLKQVIWVAEPSSRHMDWHEVPAGAGGKIEIAVWHEILEELSSADLPHENIEEASVAKVVFANIGSKEQTTGVSNMMEMEQRVSTFIFSVWISSNLGRILSLPSLPNGLLSRQASGKPPPIISSLSAH